MNEKTEQDEFTIDHLDALENQGIYDKPRGEFKKHKPKNEASKQKPRNVPEKDMAFVKSQGRAMSFGSRDGGEIELYPFDTYRMTAAQNMGMKAFNMSEDAAAEFQETGTYNGILLDAILVGYLCSKPETVSLRALSVPTGIRQESMKWASQNDIIVGSNNHAELMETFGGIIGDVFTSHSTTESGESDGGEEGESLGE